MLPSALAPAACVHQASGAQGCRFQETRTGTPLSERAGENAQRWVCRLIPEFAGGVVIFSEQNVRHLFSHLLSILSVLVCLGLSQFQYWTFLIPGRTGFLFLNFLSV